jgi:hypothetical protein
MAVVNRVKELANVHIHDPSASHVHRLLPQACYRLVCRSSGPEAMRTVLEVLLVDRFQHHDYSALEHFILERRNSQRPGFGR